jgi:hypothetical protein
MRRTFCILAATAWMLCVFCTSGTAQSPITNISTKMTGVAGELAKTKTGAPVQTEQKAIVRDLDDLIAALEKECQACMGGIKRNNPRRGLPDSIISRGTGGIGDLSDPGQSEKDWAKLSSRERDRILQSMSEGFPPEYRQVLERYYRRLAEEKTGSASAQAGGVGERPQPKAEAPKVEK